MRQGHLCTFAINGVLSVKCFEECYGSHIASRLGWIAKWRGLAGSTEVFVKAMCPVSLQSCVHVLLSIQPKLTTIPPSLSTLHKPWFACILLSANPYLQILILSKFCTFRLKLCLRFKFFSWIQLAQIVFVLWIYKTFGCRIAFNLKSFTLCRVSWQSWVHVLLCLLHASVLSNHSPSLQVLSGLFIFLSSRLQSSVLRKPIVLLHSSHPSLHPHLHLSPSLQFSKSLSILFFSPQQCHLLQGSSSN